MRLAHVRVVFDQRYSGGDSLPPNADVAIASLGPGNTRRPDERVWQCVLELAQLLCLDPLSVSYAASLRAYHWLRRL